MATKNETKTVLERVCLFGSSADPPTGEGGHVGIVRALSQLHEFDEIRMIPVYLHMYKEKRDRLLSFDHRLSMCRLAFDGIPKVCVSDVERQVWNHAIAQLCDEDKQTFKLGTADLLEYLRQTEPDVEFSFCLGADAFVDLMNGKWKHSDSIRERLGNRFVVLNRHGTTTDDLQRIIQQTPGARIVPVNSLIDVSSSKVRACADEVELRSMLDPAVVDYIKEHKLYSFGSTRR